MSRCVGTGIAEAAGGFRGMVAHLLPPLPLGIDPTLKRACTRYLGEVIGSYSSNMAKSTTPTKGKGKKAGNPLSSPKSKKKESPKPTPGKKRARSDKTSPAGKKKK